MHILMITYIQGRGGGVNVKFKQIIYSMLILIITFHKRWGGEGGNVMFNQADNLLLINNLK